MVFLRFRGVYDKHIRLRCLGTENPTTVTTVITVTVVITYLSPKPLIPVSSGC